MGTSLAVWWLGLGTFTARALGSIPGQESKIPQAKQRSPLKKKKTQMAMSKAGDPSESVCTACMGAQLLRPHGL